MADTLLVDTAAALRAATAAFPRLSVATVPKDLEPLRGLAVSVWFADAAKAATLSGRLLALDCTVSVIEPNGSPLSALTPDEAREYMETHAIPVEKPAPERLPPKIPDDIQATLIPSTDLYNARRFFNRHGQNIRFTVERSWLIWSGQRWQVDDKGVGVATLARESAESMLDEIRSAPDRNEAFKAAKLACQKRAIEAAVWLARAEPGVYAQLTTFDTDPWVLNAPNGIINLKTGVLEPHNREARCTMMTGVPYLDIPTPRYDQFMQEITLGNADLIDYLDRMSGYLLTANVREHCLFFLHGSGRNGKSVFVETLLHAMGDYAIAAEPDMLMTRKHAGIPNDVARLRGVRAVFLNETNQGHRFDEAKLKNLTGGDTLNARFLREEFFDFKPTHKIILRGNHKPTVSGTDEGIWSRLRLIPFDLRLTPDQLDRTLSEILQSELPGILFRAVRGCIAWQQRGLNPPAIMNDAVTNYRNESDTLGRFIEERCVANPNGREKSGTMFEAYRTYCERGSERYLSVKDFPEEMERRGFSRLRSNGMRFITGIELRVVSDHY